MSTIDTCPLTSNDVYFAKDFENDFFESTSTNINTPIDTFINFIPSTVAASCKLNDVKGKFYLKLYLMLVSLSQCFVSLSFPRTAKYFYSNPKQKGFITTQSRFQSTEFIYLH